VRVKKIRSKARDYYAKLIIRVFTIYGSSLIDALNYFY